jgi:serine-type D-Ala-D-Ala carboxypeptidase/endopeptidase (penicillin-binding protein 4)
VTSLARAAAGSAVLALLWSSPAVALDRTPLTGIVKPGNGGASWGGTEIAALQTGLAADLAGAATLRGTHVGLLVLDTAGHSLFAHGADDAFQSASTLKLLVGSTALDRLGPEYRFTTTVESAPSVSGGTTLVLRGGGDPLLRATDLDAAAQAVADARLSPPLDLVLDISHVAPSERNPPGWSLDDILAPYAPVIDGLPFEENRLHVQVVPGAVGEPPTVDLPPPFRPQDVPPGSCQGGPTLLTFTIAARTVAAGTESTLDAERGRCGDVVLTGVVPAGAPEKIDVAVEQPEALARMTLVAALERRGIAVSPPDPGAGPIAGVVALPYRREPAGTVLWRHDGEPLRDLLADMWFPSDNLIAEMLLRELDVAANHRAGTAAGGIALERAWLRGIGADPSRTTLADGSGLSQYNRITPRILAAILSHDWTGPYRDLVLDDLPVAGRRGTLSGVMRSTPAEGRVFAKDGAMSHIRSLAGYIATRKHGTVLFVLLVDDWLGADPDLERLRAAVCGRLATS